MKKHCGVRGVKIAAIVIAALLVFGLATMLLWNWLMPEVFGLRTIGYWQAVGLLILGRILFGGFRGGWGGRPGWRRRMKERWEQMTPEEHEKFREGMRGWCGPGAPEAKA